MRNIGRALIVFFALPGSVAFAQASRAADAEVVQWLRAHLEKLSSQDRFSGAVLLANGEKVLFLEAYGLADRGAKVPNTAGTQFPLASVSKVFTAVAVLQLGPAR